MFCPHCQVENREGRRFCAGCGKILPAPCSVCGFLNEAGEKFCGGCGRDLAMKADGAARQPSAEAQGDRRPVTVMFVDLSGYTALSARLDPEDTHRLLRRFFELVDGIAVEFGGTIDKHMGDSVMALFGAPISHGNDPERAIRAALAIQAAMAGLGVEFGRELSVHIGVALGEVVASGLGSAEHAGYTVTGEAANLAARLMERAAPGETLVAAALHEATESTTEFADLGVVEFKGLGRPEHIYRLGELKSGVALEHPMVGRRSEMGQLMAMLAACQRDKRGGAVAIRGDPGIGKSRLMRALKREAAAHGFTCHTGLILDFGAKRGGDALAAVAADLIGIPLEAEDVAKSRAIGDFVAAAGLPPSDQPFLHDLLGLAQPVESRAVYAAMDAAARQRGKSAMLERLLRTASQHRPRLIAIEDAHWADETTRHLLARLAGAAATCAVVLAITTRFDGDPFDAAWRAQSAGGLSATIDLRPLRDEEAKSLAVAVIDKLDAFARQCIERAEGNPLFLEQLLRSHLADPTGRLPHSLQGVVLARLDSLAESDKQALQAASVLGQRFALDDLRSLIGVAEYDVRAVVQRQLLRPEGDGFLFAHALIRDGIYASLTREHKRGLHLKAAQRYAGRDPVLEAEHLDRAEDTGAPQAYLRAAEAEAATYHLDRANTLVTRGLELATKDEDRLRLGLAAGKLRLDAGLARAARLGFEVAVAAAAADQDVDRCRGLIGLAAADRILADLDQAMNSLAAAEEIAVTVDSPLLLSEIHYLRGNLHFARGEGAACEAEHRQALAAAKRAGLPEWKARARSGLGDAAYLQGRVETARRQFQVCVDVAKRHGLLRIIPANQCMIGDCLSFQLHFEDGIRQNVAARAAAIKIGDRFAEMFAWQSESYVLLAARRWNEAEAPAETALDLAVKLGARRYQAFLQMTLCQVRLAQGRAAEGRQLIDTAMTLAEETGLGFAGPLICACQALARGPGAEARACIARGEAMLKDFGLVHNHVFFRVFAIDWAINAEDWPLVEELADALSAYTAAEPLAYADLVIARARALASLSRDADDRQALEILKRLQVQAQAVDFRLDFGPLH